MAEPAPVPPVPFRTGDPLVIAFVFPGEDRTNKTFASHITEDPSTRTYVPFTVDCYLKDGDTWLVLSLVGDTALGTGDGQTRTISLTSIYDVQQLDTNAPETTIFEGRLVGRQDVTI